MKPTEKAPGSARHMRKRSSERSPDVLDLLAETRPRRSPTRTPHHSSVADVRRARAAAPLLLASGAASTRHNAVAQEAERGTKNMANTSKRESVVKQGGVAPEASSADDVTRDTYGYSQPTPVD